MTFAESQIDAALMAFGGLDVGNRVNRERMAAALSVRADGGKGEAGYVMRNGVRCMIGCSACTDEPECAWHQVCVRSAPQAECAPRADADECFADSNEAKDAARYRWLRQRGTQQHTIQRATLNGESLDRNIDAAILAANKGKK